VVLFKKNGQLCVRYADKIAILFAGSERIGKMQHVRDRVSAVVLFVFAATAWWVSRDYQAAARMVPHLLTSSMMVLSAIMFVRSFLPAFRSSDLASLFANKGNFAGALVLILAYFWLMPKLGYFTASTLFLLSFSLFLGFRRSLWLVVSTAVFLVMVYGTFVALFERQLPREFFLS
jgi:hypothetical protein